MPEFIKSIRLEGLKSVAKIFNMTWNRHGDNCTNSLNWIMESNRNNMDWKEAP